MLLYDESYVPPLLLQSLDGGQLLLANGSYLARICIIQKWGKEVHILTIINPYPFLDQICPLYVILKIFGIIIGPEHKQPLFNTFGNATMKILCIFKSTTTLVAF